MKRLALSAIFTLAFLAVPAQNARADGCGFSVGIGLNFHFNCYGSGSCGYGGCGPSPPCYGFGPCFAPAYCQPGGCYGAVAPAPYGYPGYPGVAYGNPAAGPAYGHPPAAPVCAPKAAPPATQQVGYYYPQAGYSGYAVPTYWYGR